MKKILVTGATGFIGKYVIEELLERGYSIVASSSDIKSASQKNWYNYVTYIPFNLKYFDDNVNYFEFFKEPDLLIHLAWEGLPNYKADFHISENLPRHFSFLKNIIKNGLKDLTVTGTCLEYGMIEGCLSEEMNVDPHIAYGIAKNELRIKLENLSKTHPFNFKWARLFYMFGEGQNSKSLISQLDCALENGEEVFNMSGGEQLRDFLPVKLMAEYIIEIAVQNKTLGIINCCSGNPVSVKDFVLNYLDKKEKKIKLNPGFYNYADYEPMEFWGDTRKLKTIIIK